MNKLIKFALELFFVSVSIGCFLACMRICSMLAGAR